MTEKLSDERLAELRALQQKRIEGRGGVPEVRDLVKALDELDRLRRWKAEAVEVHASWEQTWEAAGRPGRPGSSKAEAVRAEVERLRRQLDAADRQIEARTGETVGERLFKALAKETRVQLNAVRELVEKGVKLADPMFVVSVGYAEACSDVLAILDGSDT
jgi:hypothetical protein